MNTPFSPSWRMARSVSLMNAGPLQGRMVAKPYNTPWQRYRDYLAQSRGEFCVAQNGYVRSH